MPLVFRQKKKKKTTKTTNMHIIFDNFPLINCLIFMLKYPILVLEQDGGIFKQKTKKIIIRKVVRIVVHTLLFSPPL